MDFLRFVIAAACSDVSGAFRDALSILPGLTENSHLQIGHVAVLIPKSIARTTLVKLYTPHPPRRITGMAAAAARTIKKPGPKSKPLDWDAIQTEIVAGVPSDEVGAKYGVAPGWIRAKASDENWPTPARLAKAAKRAREAARNAANAVPPANPAINPQQDLTESIGGSLGEIGSRNAMTIARFAARQIAAAVESEAVGRPENWKELATAFGLVEKATGRDKPLTAIQVNIGGQMWADVDPGDVAEPL